MLSLLRVLMVWLMALALPLQGLAATAMLHCGPMHEQMQGVGAAVPSSSVDEHRHGASEPNAHAHHETAIDSTVAAGDAPSDVFATDNNMSCSACAACCSALGIPSSSITIATPPVDIAVIQRPTATGESFVPDGLERPPRSFLA